MTAGSPKQAPEQVVEVAGRLAERFAERAPSYDEAATFPDSDIEDMRQAGLLGLMVPEHLGGLGAGFRDYARVAMALARGNGSSALIFNMHASVTGALAGIPDELARQLGVPDSFFETRDRIFARAVDGALYGVAISEPEAGSRLSALQTTYAHEGNGYRLRGNKSVCSGAGYLDAYLVAARDAHAGEGEDPRISYFLVPEGQGIVVDQTWDPLGMRATASNGFSLDVHVPAEALVGGVEGLAVLLAYAMPQWLVASYASVYVGVGRTVVDEAVAHLSRRLVRAPAPDSSPERGGLARIASVRARVGRADAKVEAARLVLEEAARAVDMSPGDPETNRWIYRSKLVAGDAALDVAASCTEACGLGALQRGSVLERLFRDARSGAIMPPSSDVCADVLGTAALGLDPLQGTDVRPW